MNKNEVVFHGGESDLYILRFFQFSTILIVKLYIFQLNLEFDVIDVISLIRISNDYFN